MERHGHSLLNHLRGRHPIVAMHTGERFDCPCLFARGVVERWGSRVVLILAATIVSLLLEMWINGGKLHHSLPVCFLHSFIYSTSIGLLLIYSFSIFSARISRQPFPLNWLLLFLTIIISSAAGCLISSVSLSYFDQHPPEEFMPLTIHSLQISLLLGLVFGTSFYLYDNLKGQLEATTLELRTKQLEEERARKLAIAMQLASLESRVRPHFLFNTLNSISALTREDPARAERMVERLSALLRFSLDSNHHSTVPLRDEVKIVTDYLEIERARFGQRLRFSVEVPGELGTVEVLPFSLQTLVENSIKYCVAPRREGGEIRLRARADNGLVRLEVHDDGPGFTAEEIPAGHGLDNLQSRLAALFADKASFGIRAEGRFTVATVSIPRSAESEGARI
ncbi:MAG TPA: histidine kinase [Blastocatellia bacterium]|nr:histidine kinase [Blastocatellia bacterium]